MAAMGQNGQASLLDAAAAGRTAEVSRLIAAEADLEARDAQGRSPLLLAVAGNHVAIAKALLAAGANINAQAANRDTPWLLAGAAGRAEIVAAMIPLKPDLTIRNRYGGVSVIPASERGHVDYVRRVVTTGIDVDHVNDLGWTALLEAVILADGGRDHQEIVRILLAAGADRGIADKDGVTALQHARAHGYDELVRLLGAPAP
jgi:uncharacterized protein